MKRISREHTKFDLMRLLDRYARSRDSAIHDEANQAAFLADLTRDFETNRSNEILIHGLRIQAMFAYVAAALGRCVVIKEEDAGEIYTSNSIMRAPDFRIVTTDGRELLVEVKSHRPSRPTAPYSLTCSYLDSLRAYAAAFSRDLYIAIYWSRFKTWSFVPADRFDVDRDRYLLSIEEAMKRSEMAVLGDCTIGTIPHLALKLYADPEKPNSIGPDGHAQFTIGRAELFCGDELIVNAKEREIAWFLMNYGNWPSDRTPPEVLDGKVISVGLQTSPTDRANLNQQFEIVGSLSQMISREYNEATASTGRVDLLAPKRDPDELGVLIPPGFLGDKLRLWFFVVKASEH